MKKYIINNADGSAQDVMPALHSSRKEALLTILDYATKVVEDEKDDGLAEIPANYIVEVIEGKDVNEQITNFESTKEIIGPDGLFHVATVQQHVEALIALNKLFTIAEAWNKEDEFVPDFSDCNQDKWFPCFVYNKDAVRFVYAYTVHASTYAGATFGSRLCFKTLKRAKQFGKQFIDLFNKVFL